MSSDPMPAMQVFPAPRIGTVRVVIPVHVANNLELLQKAVANSIASIVGQGGCRACCSGIDIVFENERNFFVDVNSLRLRSAVSPEKLG